MTDLARELARATSAAARAVAALRGCGDAHAVDAAAVQALRDALAEAHLDGVVVVGEGEKDRAPMLAAGEHVGNGRGPAVDIAVDPVDGTACVAADEPGALVAVGACARGTMLIPEGFYLDKLITRLSGLRLDMPVPDLVEAAAAQLGRPPVVAVLDRERNATIAAEARAAGAAVVLLPHADVAASLVAALPDGDIDILRSSGGAPEGIACACACAALGATMQCRAYPDGGDVLHVDDMVGGAPLAFAASAVTDTRALAAGETIAIDLDDTIRLTS